MGKGTPATKNVIRGIVLVVWVIFAGVASGQEHEKNETEVPGKFVLKGLVLSQSDSVAIAGAHVLNPMRRLGSFAAQDGRFAITVAPGDEIRFTAVGFESLTMVISDSLAPTPKEMLKVFLEEKIYELPTVDVFPYATFTEFKYAFLNFKDPDPPFELNLPGVEREQEPLRPGEFFRTTAPGPISVLYDYYSRREREKRRYQEVMEEEELARRASRVINQRVVKNLTGLDTEEEYYAFLNFCNMSNHYIVNTPEYEVYARLIDCYHQFALLKE